MADAVRFFNHMETAAHPAGITVSKRESLPSGDFRLTEYCWGRTSLWFVDADNFTSDERQVAYERWLANLHKGVSR